MPSYRQVRFLVAALEAPFAVGSFIERGNIVPKLSASRKRLHTVSLGACEFVILQCSECWV